MNDFTITILSHFSVCLPLLAFPQSAPLLCLQIFSEWIIVFAENLSKNKKRTDSDAISPTWAQGIIFGMAWNQMQYWTLECCSAILLTIATSFQGLSREEALGQFWVLDANGLLTKKRAYLSPTQECFARPAQDSEGPHDNEGESLLSVIKRVSSITLTSWMHAYLIVEQYYRTYGTTYCTVLFAIARASDINVCQNNVYLMTLHHTDILKRPRGKKKHFMAIDLGALD